jgi:hypothetical protein
LQKKFSNPIMPDMRIERESVREAAFYNIQNFVNISGLGQGVDFVVLKGSAVNEKIEKSSYVAIALSHLYGDIMSRKKYNMIFDKKSNNPYHICNGVSGLKIPNGGAEEYAEIDTDQDIYDESRADLALRGMPYVALELGETKITGTEVAILYFAAGVSPEDALSEIQQAVLSHKLGLVGGCLTQK